MYGFFPRKKQPKLWLSTIFGVKFELNNGGNQVRTRLWRRSDELADCIQELNRYNMDLSNHLAHDMIWYDSREIKTKTEHMGLDDGQKCDAGKVSYTICNACIQIGFTDGEIISRRRNVALKAFCGKKPQMEMEVQKKGAWN